MQDHIVKLFNRLMAAINVRIRGAEMALLAQDYDLAVGLSAAADAVAGVTVTTITAASGGSLVEADAGANTTFTYTGSHVIPAGTTARIAFGNFYVWEGSQVKLTIGSTVVVNDTVTTPTGYFDIADIATGTQSVKLEIIVPKTTRRPTTTNWFLRSEKLV